MDPIKTIALHLQARLVKTVKIRVRLAEDLHGQDRQLRYRVIDNWGCYRLGHRSVISTITPGCTLTLPTFAAKERIWYHPPYLPGVEIA
jgi:hypothetical protein